jgi:hypothetical protein
VRLETRPLPGIRLDILVTLGQTRVALELKCLLRKLSATSDREPFELPSQAAQDVRRYDFIKDIVRLEQLVPDVADIGYAIALTNDPSYWQESGRRDLTDMAFRLHEGRELAGDLVWGPATGAGTMKKREGVLRLRGSYKVSWRDFSEVEGTGFTRFRYAAVKIG